MAEDTGKPGYSAGEIARTTALVTLVVGTFATAFIIFWLASTAIIAIGAAILVAVLFDSGASGLGHIMPGSRKLRLVLLFVLAACLIGAAIWWGGTILVQQANLFFSAMEGLLKRAADFMKQGGLGFEVRMTDLTQFLPSGGTVFGGARTIASFTFSTLTLMVAIIFLGAFFVWEPTIYKAIILSLIPKGNRERVNEVLDKSGHAMREWLVGQSISMLVVFVSSLAALLLIGMPYPILLAVQAGLLAFIPTLGPFVAGVIIILAGLSQSVVMALYGVGTYILIQFLESNFVTPLVQKQIIRLPPAAILALQLVATFLFGLIGVAFVVPLAAAAKVLVEELYVNDRLGGAWQVHETPSRIIGWMDRKINEWRGRKYPES